MRLVVLALVCVVLLPRSAHAQSFEVVEAGTFRVQKGACQRDDAGILLCERLGLRLDQKTQLVPAVLEIEFGVRYRVLGLNTDTPVLVRRVWKLPAPGFLPPGKPPIREIERHDSARVGDVITATYGFDDPWELVTGEWVLEFWIGSRKIGEQQFTVLRPTS